MRFSTLVAFMLPLSALAVPLVKPQLDINVLRDQLVLGLQGASGAFTVALGQTGQKLVIDDINAAQDLFKDVGAAVVRIGAAIDKKQPPAENDQFIITKNVLRIQTIIVNLPAKIDTKADKAAALLTSVATACLGNSLAIEAGLDILQVQKKTVRQLFHDASDMDIPAGF